MPQNRKNLKKIINWNGLSVVLTGKTFKIRSTRSPKEQKEVVISLLEHIEQWATENNIEL